MKFGIAFANTMRWAEPDGAIEAARAAEAAGFESLWTVEHVIFPEGYQSEYPYSPTGKMPGTGASPIPDPLIWLAYLASVTSTIRLATGVLILPQRNPLVLAKEVASLDRLSGGRVELGIGVGWLEEEFDALGVSFADRGARADEYIAAMRALWASDAASFSGRFVDFTGATSNPKPAQGLVPIVVGGHSKAAARRAGRLGDGFFPAKGTPAELAELIALMRRTAEEHGRDPDAIEITAGAIVHGDTRDPLAVVEEYAALGVTRMSVPAFSLMRPTTEEAMAAFAENVIVPAGVR